MIDSLVTLLSQPGIGILLGLLLAVTLFRLSKSSFDRMTPEDSFGGLLFITISLFARLALVTVVLWAYKRFAPDGFTPFALSLAGGFLVLFSFETVRYAGLLGKGRSRTDTAKGR